MDQIATLLATSQDGAQTMGATLKGTVSLPQATASKAPSGNAFLSVFQSEFEPVIAPTVSPGTPPVSVENTGATDEDVLKELRAAFPDEFGKKVTQEIAAGVKVTLPEAKDKPLPDLPRGKSVAAIPQVAVSIGAGTDSRPNLDMTVVEPSLASSVPNEAADPSNTVSRPVVQDRAGSPAPVLANQPDKSARIETTAPVTPALAKLAPETPAPTVQPNTALPLAATPATSPLTASEAQSRQPVTPAQPSQPVVAKPLQQAVTQTAIEASKVVPPKSTVLTPKPDASVLTDPTKQGLGPHRHGEEHVGLTKPGYTGVTNTGGETPKPSAPVDQHKGEARDTAVQPLRPETAQIRPTQQVVPASAQSVSTQLTPAESSTSLMAKQPTDPKEGVERQTLIPAKLPGQTPAASPQLVMPQGLPPKTSQEVPATQASVPPVPVQSNSGPRPVESVLKLDAAPPTNPASTEGGLVQQPKMPDLPLKAKVKAIPSERLSPPLKKTTPLTPAILPQPIPETVKPLATTVEPGVARKSEVSTTPILGSRGTSIGKPPTDTLGASRPAPIETVSSIGERSAPGINSDADTVKDARLDRSAVSTSQAPGLVPKPDAVVNSIGAPPQTVQPGLATLSPALAEATGGELDATAREIRLNAETVSGPKPTVTPAPQPGAAAQVARQIASAVQGNASGNAIEITLSPAELGRVRINLSNGETGLSVSIVADRPETIDLMRRNADVLEQDFRDIGFDSTAFSFAGSERQGQNAGGDTADGAAQASQPDSELSNANRSLAISQPIQTGSGRVDLRL